MKITIEATDRIVKMGDGQRARQWKGVTESGIACDVFVPVIRVSSVLQQAEFQAELEGLPDPSAPAVDLRMLI